MSVPTDYPSSLYSPELKQKEHTFLLYPHELFSVSERKIGGHSGDNFVLNWPVYDGLGTDAKLVARVQGIYWSSGDATADLVFTDERFPSTLKIAGYYKGVNELGIVGGTGEFAMAQGIVKASYISESSTGKIREFNIRAMCPMLSPAPVQKNPVTKGGTWGGKGGKDLDIADLPLRLESVTIGSSDVLYSLAFSYIDQGGNKKTAGPWGGGGGLKETIQLAPTETINKITGTTGDLWGNTVVTSITIHTNVGIYGPFGKAKGNPFNTPDESSIVGFYVRAGDCVDNLGVYVQKN